MDSFIVSARKYRPVTFRQVVGQKAITSTLQNAIKSNHLAQAFLFTGPRGVGKTTCARIMAKTINCENLTPELEPCDKCESCTSFNNNASFNIHELDAASNNSVDDIRNLVEQVRIPPQIGTYKVYIIDEVHMLSQAAFNAFLKTLEEPPAYAKFILATTEKHKILPTILSRCQIFDFRRIGVEDISEHLAYVAKSENIIAEDEALNVIAQKADGALRDALSTFDQIVSYSGNTLTYKSVIENLNILDYEYFFKVSDAIINGDIPSLLLIFGEIIDNGFDGQHFIMGLADHLRSLLVLKNETTIDLLIASQRLKESYSQQASHCSPSLLMNALKICNQYDLNYKGSNNKRLHIEIALIQLGQLSNEGGGFSNTVVARKESPSQSGERIEGYNKEEKKIISTPERITPKTEVKVVPVAAEKTVENTVPKVEEKKVEVKQEVVAKPEVKVTSPTQTPEPEAKTEKEVKSASSPRNEDNGRRIKRISITDSLRALKKGKETADEENVPVIKTEFSQEYLVQVWQNFVSTYSLKSPSFASAIGKYKPELKDNFVIEYKVDNKIMANDILHQTSLLEFLKKETNNNQITLKPILPTSEEKKIAYFDKEKFDELAKDYPGIIKLKEQLNLDFGV